MKKQILIGIALVLSLAMTASAWDVLAHAFIMEQIKGGAENANGNEVYGIDSPDFANYLLGTPYYNFMYDQTHTNFMRVWHMSGNGMRATAEQQLAMGFVAHNGLWGADYIAHVASLEDASQGYVIAQAIYLSQLFDTVPVDQEGHTIWQLLGIPAAMAELRVELCHNIVEYIIDIQVSLADPTLAARVVNDAVGRDSSFPGLLDRAYSKLLADFSQSTEAPLSHAAATALIQGYEAAFKTRVAGYAQMFVAAGQDVNALIGSLSVYLSDLANTLYGPYGVSTTPVQVAGVLGFALQALPSALAEIEGTVDYVKGQMAAHHIVYGPKGIMSRVEEGLAPKGRIRN